MSSMGDNTKSADVSISVDDQSSSIPPPKIATTASEPLPSKKSRVFNALFDSYSATKSLPKEVVTQPVALGKMDFEKIRARRAASFIDARYSKEANSFNRTENKTELDIYLMEMKDEKGLPPYENTHLDDLRLNQVWKDGRWNIEPIKPCCPNFNLNCLNQKELFLLAT
ncbi:hypothetical protein ACH5RR_008549 [Cinchona calisaya]|uniref:Uncharacterized protein n=1 Tax=Cinchona calisaya TaxID=153742 RepID=A0ABD3ABY4_9GENT